MKITTKLLRVRGACSAGVDGFIRNRKDGEDVTPDLLIWADKPGIDGLMWGFRVLLTAETCATITRYILDAGWELKCDVCEREAPGLRRNPRESALKGYASPMVAHLVRQQNIPALQMVCDIINDQEGSRA